LLETQPCLVRKRKKVLIEERIDGTIFLSLREKCLNYKELSKRSERIKEIPF